MINSTLFRREIKANWLLFVIIAAIVTMYSSMIIMMFEPELGDSLKAMSESMPELFAAFGMADVGTTLLEFIISYLYGMIMLIFPSVFILILTNRLVAQYVSSGSMAYLLAAPVKRVNIISSQALFLLSSLIIMALYVVFMICGVSETIFSDQLDIGGFIRINIGLLGLWIFIGGICFFTSSIFNDSRRVTGINAGIIIYSYLIQMISRIGDKFEALKYLTPLNLYNVDGLAAGKNIAWLGCIILYIIGIIFILISIRIFSKRSLPI